MTQFRPKINMAGFTLMEILVATTVFAIVVAALMSMFNYTLKINRRSESLRQATQGMRDLIELLAKEVRSGQIDYGVLGGQAQNVANYPLGACTAPTVGSSGNPIPVGDTYTQQSNKFAILTSGGDYECFFLAEGPGNSDGPGGTPLAVGTPVNGFGSSATNPNPILAMKKNTLPLEIITPLNLSVQKVMFMVRPLCDPYSPGCSSYSGYPKVQPFVTILAQFRVVLPTGEKTDIYYQTSVSSNKYDIYNQ